MITKLDIFDFDKTIMETMDAGPGIRAWERITGLKFAKPDWFKTSESLDIRLPHIPIWETIHRADESLKNRSSITILMTGRKDHLRSDVIDLCDFYDIKFQRYFCTPEHMLTLEYKLRKLAYLLDEYPEVVEVEMWDDRHHHADAFEALGNELGVSIFVNRV